MMTRGNAGAARKTSFKHAFTLIELLVVVSIIALLVSILLPALGQARKQAQKTVCGVNLKQIGMGIEIYTSESNGIMPLILERHWGTAAVTGLVGEGRGRTWAGIIKDQSKIDMGLFRCPTDKRKYVLTESFFWVPLWPSENSPAFSYGVPFVEYLSSSRRVPWSMPSSGFPARNSGAFKKERIANPYTMHLIWDAQTDLLSNGASFDTLKKEILYSYRSYWNDTIFRHGRGVNDTKAGPNVLLADGHVEYAYDLAKLTRDNVNIALK